MVWFNILTQAIGLSANLESTPSPKIAQRNSTHNELQHNSSLNDNDTDDNDAFHPSHNDHAIEELNNSLPFQMPKHKDAQMMMNEEGCIKVRRWKESETEFESGYEGFRGVVNSHEKYDGLSANNRNFSDEQEVSF